MSDRIVLRNGIVVTLNDADDVLFGGNVVIEGDRIALVTADPVPADGARVIDATERIVMPGLVDFHYHTALGKGYSDHLPLWEYLQTCWYPMIRALDPESAYWAALASYSESIKCGVTAVNDMYRRL
ncbi:MAG TPA: amidohydrolase family protein, partial [Gaiellaceae bacterium]|nr:amidohydrolase family protein [Gaiellaceae bacterium]